MTRTWEMKRASKVYGASDATLLYIHGTLLNGDGSSVFTGALGRAGSETVLGGPYAINQGNLSAGTNYTISFMIARPFP